MTWRPLVLLLLLPGAVQAQGQGAYTELAAPAPEPAPPLVQEQRAGPGWVTLHTLGGTLMGAWLGYIGSQVRYSDWDRDRPDHLMQTRRRYAAVGAGLGTVAGLTLSIKVGRVPQKVEGTRANPGFDFNLISLEEIERAGLANALQLVQTLRPSWLRVRGVNSWMETPDVRSSGMSLVVVREGDPQILVYQDGMLMGDVNRLKELPAVSVQSVRWLTPKEATYLYGGGHTHGAILVQTH